MKCFVKNCGNSWRKGKKKENVTFHKFTKANFREWFRRLGSDLQLEWPQPQLYKICSDHFTNDCFIRTEFQTRLKPNSVPTLRLAELTIGDVDNFNPEQSGRTDSSVTLSAPEEKYVSESGHKNLRKRLLDLSNSQSSSSGSTKMKKRVKLIGTFHNYSTSLDKVKLRTLQLKKRATKFRTKYHNTKKTVKRLNLKVQSLYSIVSTLRKKEFLSTMASDHLSQAVPKQIMARMLRREKTNTLSRSKYPPELKEFAMTLLFYSKKAYEYVRRTFNLCLPHPATIRNIYSGIDCKPGFTGSSFEVLKLKAEQYRLLEKELICSLIIDEMAIKKQITSDGQTSYGYINIGSEYIDQQMEPATEALVFLVVCHTEHWKLPIAYFLINSLDGSEKANLVNEALIRLDNNNVKITSVTCDGPSVNFKMLKDLGCRIKNTENDITYFSHPNNEGERVFAILDPCHMLKLMRNALSELGHFYDDENNLVEWRYIEMLYEMEKNENLSAATKIRKSHIEWRKQKMKVRLAAQTLSSSVADALDFLMKDLKLLQFQNAGPTIRFIRIVDRLFDILNSRSPVGRGYKAPLRKANQHFWESFLKKTVEYLRKCTLDGQTLMTSVPRKTPFVGFIITISSTMGIFDEYVKSNRLQYLLTYKYSQDHLEMFFCSVRSHNGWNNNPNALQMQHTYRRLLFHAQVKGVGGNCEAIDSTTILSLPSNRSKKCQADNFSIDVSIARKYDIDIIPPRAWEDHDYNMIYSPSLTEYSENVVTYISGYVIRMVRKRIKCPKCLAAIHDSTKCSDSNKLSLIMRKDRGSESSGLLWPSEGLIV